MRLAVIRPVCCVRRCVLAKTSCRSFSDSVARAGADKPAPRGVPLAYDLDGINIKQRGMYRPSDIRRLSVDELNLNS